MPITKHTTNCRPFYRASWSTLVLTMAWSGSTVLSRELFSQGVIPPGLFTWLVAIFPMILGVLLLHSFVQFMRALDEWWVKIYFRSFAFSFGVCILALFCYPILEFANAPRVEPFIYGGIGILVFAAAAIYNVRKYA